MEYKDQSARELRFHLLVNDLDEDSMQILETGTIEVNGIPIKARIIGCSHAISIGLFPGFSLHEVVFACPDSPGSTPLYTPQDMGCRQALGTKNNSYRFSSRLVDLDDPDVEMISQRLRQDTSREDELRLMFKFPAGPDGEDPFTGIVISGHEGGARIKTVHSYPNEGLAALTTTHLRRN